MRHERNDAMPTPSTMVSRRIMLAGLAASAALPLASRTCRAAQGVATAKRGAFEISVVSDGTLSLPVNFVLPGVPKPDVEAVMAAEGKTLADFVSQVNVTLIKTGNDLILVDTGSGADFMPSVGKLTDNLEAAGIKPEAVTKVVFTHAHADHLWGVIDPLDNGTRFTNAKHYMTAAERDFWLKPGVENEVAEAFKGMAVGTQRRLKAIVDRIEIIKPGDSVAPGIEVMATPGHTPGHISLVVGSGSDAVVVGGDVLVHPVVSFAKPDWRWGSDMDTATAAAIRARLLDRMAAEKSELLGYHLPWPGLGRVEKKGPAYRFVQQG